MASTDRDARPEPTDLTLVLIGDPSAFAPWDLEVYLRNDEFARGSTARWFWVGAKDGSVQRKSWDRIQEDAVGRKLTVLGPEN